MQRTAYLKRPSSKTAAGLFIGVIVAASVSLLRDPSICGDPSVPKEIFLGVVYGCDRVEPSEEGSGFVHWARIDLTAPGIELYVTPLDDIAVSRGWQYQLRLVGEVVKSQKLAVAVNGTLFVAKPRFVLRMPGDFANGLEPIVANGVISHMWPDAYLLWFDDELTPRLRPSKPITPAEFAMARWAIGGQDFWLRDGNVNVWPGRGHRTDSWTAIGVDLQQKVLILAVGTDISPRLIFEKLANLGAKDGMLLDGGASSSIAIGEGAAEGPTGTIFGYWRPVATHFGVRANRLNSKRLD